MAIYQQDTEEYIKQADRQKQLAKFEAGASAFSSAMGGIQNYNLTLASNKSLRVEASQVELQSKEKANQLRQQFLGAVGNYTFQAGQRGVSVKSGSVQSNIMESSANLGKDIAKQEKTAELQASALRGQAKINKIAARGKMYLGFIKGGAKMAGGMQ